MSAGPPIALRAVSAGDVEFLRALFVDTRLILLGGRPIGQLCVARGDEELRLVDISLVPEERSRGIGAQLIRTLQAEASRRGVPVRLSVLLGNPAERLYSRLRFRRYADAGPYRELEWAAAPGA